MYSSIDQQDDKYHGPHAEQEEEKWNENELGVCFAHSGQVVTLQEDRTEIL